MFTVVIDTNILITASEDDLNAAHEVIDLVIASKVRAVASRQIVSENKLLLTRRVVKKAVKQELMRYFNFVRMVRADSHERIVEEDAEDDKFVHCARAAHAHYIITHDRHLLDMRSVEGINMVTPGEFIAAYRHVQDPEGKGEWATWIKQMFGNGQ